MSESQKHLVSIGLPTFNRATSLVRAVDSLLAQTYENFELVISDNASTDNTEKICREYARNNNRIKYFRQEQNIGMVENYKFVLKKVSGDYFMMASDDDWWHPDFILKLKGALDDHKEYGIAMSSIRQIHEDGSLVNEIIYDGPNDVSKFSHSRIFNAAIFKNPPVHFFIMGLFKKEILKKIFWRPPEQVLGGDKVIIYEASLFTRFYSISDVLWIRTSSSIPDVKRYEGDYLKAFTDRWAYVKHIKAALLRLFGSPNISLSRKLAFLPLKATVLVWGFRKHLLRELFLSGFLFLKKIKTRLSLVWSYKI